MRKSSTEQGPKRVLARVLATQELEGLGGGGPDTTWTDGTPRKDFTQISAGDTPGSPPPPEV
jgi:hypothetical protein